MINRRQAICASLALAGSLHSGAAAKRTEETRSFPSVIDASDDTSGIIEEIKARNVRAVFRYYALDKQPNLPTKIITRREADALFEAGLWIGIVFQYYNNALENMNPVRGRTDAVHCLTYARQTIGQPPATALYFGVDGDWYSSSQIDNVISYFRAVNEVFDSAGRPFKVGVYGSGRTCSALKALNLAEFFWLPKSTAWAGTRDFYNAGAWHLYQNEQEVAVGGLKLDTNICNPRKTDFGLFGRAGPVKQSPQPRGVYGARRFVVQDGIQVHAGPDQSSPVTAVLKQRQMVSVLAMSRGWASLDIGERAAPGGFCEAQFLVSLDRMP